MKLTKYVPVEVEVDIKLPYYFKHNLSGSDEESLVYGRITSSEYIFIHKTTTGSRIRFDVIKEPVLDLSNYIHHIDEDSGSNQEEFENIYIEASEFLANLFV